MAFSKLAALALVGVTMAANPVFFIDQMGRTGSDDRCSYNGQHLPADNNTMHGGLCAYDTDRSLLYACPAPDTMCWGWALNCSGGDSTTPGNGQIRCPSGNGGAYIWCCDQTQECTQTPGQINVCWSKFENPNKGLSDEDANRLQSSSRAAMQSAALSSRLTALATSVPATTTLGTSTVNAVSAGSTASVTTSTSTASTSAQPSAGSSSMSTGAITGIAIGAVAVGALIGVGLFYIWQRKKKNKRMASEKDHGAIEPYSEMPDSMARYEAPLHQKSPPTYGTGPTHEMPGDGSPVEMPAVYGGRNDNRQDVY